VNVRRQAWRAMVASGISVVVVGSGVFVPAGAAVKTVQPSSLSRGANPAIAYLVRDVIHDGAARVTATHRGQHQHLWVVDGGYVVQDWLPRHSTYRLVFIGTGTHAGDKLVIGRSHLDQSATVSPGGDRIAWTRGPNDLSKRTTVTVSEPATGKVVASRTFRWARVLGVTLSRVLLVRRDRPVQEHPTTVWWNHRRHRVTTIALREAVRADLPHNRIVVATGQFDEPAFCNRVAPLSHPRRTLWQSCHWAPHAWSPDGTQVVATHTYFDDVGTDRWLALRADNANRLGHIRGRLDWTAVWEDDRHYLTLALGDDGMASVIRCTVGGTCERSSRLFDVGKATAQPNYIAPPVVLSSN
jgi:hypothetical protein